MKFRSYLDKHLILRKEAMVDLNNGAYNKAVSALWFSLEALFRALLIREGRTPPDRLGKLISYTIKSFFSHIDNLERFARIVNTLYTMRTQVDHRDKIATKVYAEKALNLYREALEIITKVYRITQ